jgi:hypothetical protein
MTQKVGLYNSVLKSVSCECRQLAAAFQWHSTTTAVPSAPTFRYQSLAYDVQDYRSQTVHGSLYCRRHEVTIERKKNRWTPLVQLAAPVCIVRCGQKDGFACVWLLAVVQTGRNYRCCLVTHNWARDCSLLERCEKSVAHKLTLEMVQITGGDFRLWEQQQQQWWWWWWWWWW